MIIGFGGAKFGSPISKRVTFFPSAVSLCVSSKICFSSWSLDWCGLLFSCTWIVCSISNSPSCFANGTLMPSVVAEFIRLVIVICSASGSIVGKPWACFTLDTSIPMLSLFLISERSCLSTSRIWSRYCSSVLTQVHTDFRSVSRSLIKG